MAESESSDGGRLVLVVDDDEAQAAQIAQFLTRHGIAVVIERNGFAAVSTIRHHQPAIVLLDIKLPDMNGMEVVRLAAKNHPQTRFILMSGYADAVVEAHQAHLNVHSVIEKPVPLRTLLRYVQRALEQTNRPA